MKKFLIFIIPVWVITCCYGQDTIFYNTFNKKVKSTDNWFSYDVFTKTGKNNKLTRISRYNVKGELQSETEYSNIEKKIKEGIDKIYWENGTLRYSANYKKGLKEGTLESFTVTGWKKRNETYLKGVMTQGTCYDSLGNVINYFPYEVMPTFESCKNEKDEEARSACFDKKYAQFLDANLKYPDQARNQNIQGKVWVGFIVDKDGSIKNIEILRDIGGGCGDEVLRVMSLMPQWSPGIQDGEVVTVKYRMPINFTLR